MLHGDETNDNELDLLSSSLPLIVTKGLAPSTTSKYQAGWRGWVDWCEAKSLTSRPADPYYVALYINRTYLLKRKKGHLKCALYGISWGHCIVGLSSPTENPLVQLAFSGALRLCPGSKSPKDPIPVDTIKAVVDSYRLRPHNLMECRTIVVILLGFSGFFRISELISIRLRNVTFLPEHVEIFLPSLNATSTDKGTPSSLPEHERTTAQFRTLRSFCQTPDSTWTSTRTHILYPACSKQNGDIEHHALKEFLMIQFASASKTP